MRILSRMIILVIVGLIVVLSVWAQKENKESNIMEKLRSKDEELQREAKKEILTKRKELIEGLINILRDEKIKSENRSCALTAATILGELRATEAVEILAENMSLRKKSPIVSGPTLWLETAYPCMGALIKIGKPSIPAMVKLISENDDEDILHYAGFVIKEIEGKKIGKLILVDALATETDKEKQKRLKIALEYLEGKRK